MYVRTYVCMYVRTYVCTNVCMYERMYVCTYVCTNVCMYERMYVCMYERMYVRTYVCTNVCMYERMYVCTYVCTNVCMYICMYVRMYVSNTANHSAALKRYWATWQEGEYWAGGDRGSTSQDFHNTWMCALAYCRNVADRLKSAYGGERGRGARNIGYPTPTSKWKGRQQGVKSSWLALGGCTYTCMYRMQQNTQQLIVLFQCPTQCIWCVHTYVEAKCSCLESLILLQK